MYVIWTSVRARIINKWAWLKAVQGLPDLAVLKRKIWVRFDHGSLFCRIRSWGLLALYSGAGYSLIHVACACCMASWLRLPSRLVLRWCGILGAARAYPLVATALTLWFAEWLHPPLIILWVDNAMPSSWKKFPAAGGWVTKLPGPQIYDTSYIYRQFNG